MLAEPRPRLTINQIASLAGVSKKTVSRVINDSPHVKGLTRDRVKAIIEKHGYIPDPSARALALQRSFLLGFVYDNPSPQYVVNMQRGILDALVGTSLQLVLQPCDRGDKTFRKKVSDFVTQHRPFGLVLTPSVSEDEDLADDLRKLNCNYVRIASVELDTPARMVRTHDADGAAQAARHLAALGHKRIAHIHGPFSFRSAHERLRGFREGLRDFSISIEEKFLVEGAYTFESGVTCAERLLYRRDRPTAIFAGNDEMAMGIYVAARKAALRIPEDLSVVGFDDSPMASRIWPSMTTVRLPIRDMGHAATRMLVEKSAAAKLQTITSFFPEIIVRESTRPPA